MNEQENQIKENFKEEHQHLHDNRWFNFNGRFLGIAGVYALLAVSFITLIVSLILVLFVGRNTNFIYPISNSEAVIEEVLGDTLSLGIVPIEVYDDYGSQFPNFINVVYTAVDNGQAYVFIINSYGNNLNFTGDSTFGYFNEDETIFTFRSEIVDQILSGQITTWETNNFNIKIFITHPTIRQLPSFIVNSALVDYPSDSDSNLTASGLMQGLSSFLIYLVALIPLCFIAKPYLKDDFDALKRDSVNVAVTNSFYAFLFVMAANIVAGIVVQIFAGFGHSIPTSANQVAIERIVHSPGAVFMIISAVLIGPIVEELFFRKAIIGVINNRKAALIVSSVLFALVHITEEIGTGNLLLISLTGLSYLLAGFAFGYAYLKYNKNIWYPIFGHMLLNAFSFLMMFIR